MKNTSIGRQPKHRKKTTLTVIVIDPIRKTIFSTAMTANAGNALPAVQRIIRHAAIGEREIMTIGLTPLWVCAGADVDRDIAKWRFHANEDTTGRSILIGKMPNGAMCNCPVTVDWVRQRVIWVDGEQVFDCTDAAEETLPILEDSMREALQRAAPFGNDEAWLLIEDKDLFPAFLGAGLGSSATKGQKLTSLGLAVRDLLIKGAESGSAFSGEEA